jgi:hypothetical protein
VFQFHTADNGDDVGAQSETLFDSAFDRTFIDIEESQPRKPKTNPWLTREDLAGCRSSAKQMCRSINLDTLLQEAYNGACSTNQEQDRTNALLKSSDYSRQRGLERWSSSQHAVLRSIKIIEVKTAVLLEQSRQFLTGKADPTRIAELSQQASSISQRFAEILASVDATMATQVQETSSAV